MRGTDVTDMKRKYREVKEGEFPDELTIALEKESDLRYGENPNQPAAVYRVKGTSLAEFTNIRLAKSGKGGLSATNFMDVTRALDLLKFFDKPSVAVMKHALPAGFATQFGQRSLSETYELARDADARSAFGGVVVSNNPIDTATAHAIMSTFIECVAAPEYEEGAIGILGRKEDLRVILYSNLDKIPKFVGDDTTGLYDLKALPTGRYIVQGPYLTSIRGVDDLVFAPLVRDENGNAHVVERDPTENEINDMLTSWYVNLGVRSNGIVFVKNGVTVAVGSGQMERVGAVEQAIIKAYQKAFDREGIEYHPLDGAPVRFIKRLSENPLQGAVISSDAFFPKPDSIELIAEVGTTAIIQPGGSVKDYEIIDAVNIRNIAMAYTRERCFGHF